MVKAFFNKLKIVIPGLTRDLSRLRAMLPQMRLKTTAAWIPDQVGDDSWRRWGRWVFVAIGLVLLPMYVHAGADIKPPLTGQLLAKGAWLDDAPTLPAIKFDAPNGVQINTQDYKGQWVVLHYWATWCAPCVTELPGLDKLQKKWSGTKLKVVTASADTGGPTMVQTYFKKNKLNYLPAFTVIPDEDLGLPINGIPTSFILNPRQEVLLKFEGSIDWETPDVQKFLADLMGIDVPKK